MMRWRVSECVSSAFPRDLCRVPNGTHERPAGRRRCLPLTTALFTSTEQSNEQHMQMGVALHSRSPSSRCWTRLIIRAFLLCPLMRAAKRAHYGAGVTCICNCLRCQLRLAEIMRRLDIDHRSNGVNMLYFVLCLEEWRQRAKKTHKYYTIPLPDKKTYLFLSVPENWEIF